MGKALKVAGPARPEEVQRAYRDSPDPHDRERRLALGMGQQGRWTLPQSAAAVQRGRATILRWVRADRQGGREGVLEHHYEGERRKPSLDAQERQALREGLEVGEWKSAREVQRWLKAERNKELQLATIYYWLGRMRASGKVPRKSQKKKTPSERSSVKRRGCRA